MSHGQRTWLALIAVAVAIAAGHHFRWSAHVRSEPTVPRAAVMPWMADALPGVGPVTREEMAAAMRSGRWGELPGEAAALGRRVVRD